MNYRNAKYLENGWIDCEIEHPVLGWIPFTCDPEDKGSFFDTKILFDTMVKSNKVAFYSPPSKEEILNRELIVIREKRDALLRESDILVLPDRWASYSTAKKKALTNYRQALRDLPKNVTDPSNVVWPQLAD